MARHQAFFDTLAATDSETPSWDSALAGLAVLRLADAAREDPSVIDRDWEGVRAVATAISALRDGHPMRRSLNRILDGLRDGGPEWRTVNSGIFAYGRALDLEGHWNLAADVFDMVAEIARAEHDAELAIEATTALGGAARRSGDWDRSAEGYAEAGHLADALGDKASGLTVRVGTANTHMARGNLPAAESILAEVVAEARKSGLDGVEALALHTNATIAHLKGRYDDAVMLGHDALSKTSNAAVKDTIIADIAAAFSGLGMHAAARDAYLVISMTSRYQWVRWQAAINLMEIAAIEGVEYAFDDYAAQLRNEALDPRLRAYFLLYHGQGCIRFGRDAEGVRQIEEAQRFAARHRINQVAFEAEQALAGAGTEEKQTGGYREWQEPVPAGVLEVAEALGQLREAAAASTPSSWQD